MPVHTEVQKTNKILVDIKKILGAGQTPADQKAAADAQAKAATALGDAAKGISSDRKKSGGSATDKLRDASGKFIKATEEDEKQKQTTHQKMMGLFSIIKADVTQWAVKADENQITWGNLGSVIKNSVKTWFTQVAKTNTMLGATFRIGAALWNNVFVKIGQRFTQTFDAIKSEVVDVLGPGIMALFTTMKNTLLAAWDTTKNLFGSFFEGLVTVPPADRHRNKILRGILHEAIRRRKGEFTEGLGKKKGVGLFKSIGLGTMAMILAISKVLLVFYGIYKFIEGWGMSDADTWAGKFRDGIKNVILGVAKWPLKFLEWVLSKIGFATEGMTEAVMNWVSDAIDFMWGFSPFTHLMNFFEGFMGTEGTFWEKIKGGFNMMVSELQKHIGKWAPIIMDAIKPMMIGIVNFFSGLWNGMISWLMNKVPSWLPGRDKVKQSLAGMQFNMARAGAASEISNEAAMAYQKRAQLQNMPLKEIKDLMAEFNARSDAGQRESAIALVQAARDAGGYKTEVNSQPDEVDGVMGLTLNNVDQEF